MANNLVLFLALLASATQTAYVAAVTPPVSTRLSRKALGVRAGSTKAAPADSTNLQHFYKVKHELSRLQTEVRKQQTLRKKLGVDNQELKKSLEASEKENKALVSSLRDVKASASKMDVTEAEVLQCQAAWADAIKTCSKLCLTGGDYVSAGTTAAGELYGYGHSKVLFKPTKASKHPFRPTGGEALSYFVGGKSVKNGYDEDGGFAINGGKGFSEVVFNNHGIDFNGPLAIAMGEYTFTDATTNEVSKVEYTFGYKRNADGKVRICLHHSSIPYKKAESGGGLTGLKGDIDEIKRSLETSAKENKALVSSLRDMSAIKTDVTEAEVLQCQAAWADAIKTCSKLCLTGGDYVSAGTTAAGELYGYGHSEVLFKPTKASKHPFRPTGGEALSYFVGGKSVKNGYDEDGGFAINGGKGFSEVVFNNHKVDLNGPLAIAMGEYTFTDATTNEVSKVEYTFGYKRNADGKVRIFLHHSSIPYKKAESGGGLTGLKGDIDFLKQEIMAMRTQGNREVESKKPAAKTPLIKKSWAELTPEPGSECAKTLNRCFPGALPSSALLEVVSGIMEAEGLTAENTIYGQSICSDEINQESGGTARGFMERWGVNDEHFALGGIGGAPYVGKTGFGAFSGHVPDGGNVMMLFGPHIGVSDAGELGKYLRCGQKGKSTACGAVVGAYRACKAGNVRESDSSDMQQVWLEQKINTSLDRIEGSSEPMAELMYATYEHIHIEVDKVVHTKFSDGKLVLLGGIQLNIGDGYEDHFLPLSFRVLQEGKPEVDLLPKFIEAVANHE